MLCTSRCSGGLRHWRSSCELLAPSSHAATRVQPLARLLRSVHTAQRQAGAPLIVEKHGHRQTEFFADIDGATSSSKTITAELSRGLQVALPPLWISIIGFVYVDPKLLVNFKPHNSLSSISTHALLNAVGLGAGAMPAAAAISWVLKDGMMLVAGAFGKFFDTETKRIRWAADCIHVAGVGLELATPLFPAYFLPLASVANAAKGIAGLTTGATKAAINQGLALRDNLGDITAKGHSQGIVAYLMGMGVGIGSTWITGGQLELLFGVYGVLAASHLAFSHRALSNVQLTSLSRQRLDIILAAFHEHGTVMGPDRLEERIILPSRNRSDITMGASINDVIAAPAPSGLFGRFAALASSTASPSPTLLRELVELHQGERFILRHIRNTNQTLIILHEEATSEDILRAYFGAYRLRQSALANTAVHPGEAGDNVRLERESLEYTRIHYPEFLKQLDDRGWSSNNVVLASGAHRARW